MVEVAAVDATIKSAQSRSTSELMLYNWVPPEIVALAGELLAIDQGFFEATVEAEVEESEFIDIKAGAAYAPSPKGQGGRWLSEQEFSKDVAAFANAGGGWLIIGISDDGHRATGLSPVVRSSSSVEESRLRQALAAYTAPMPVVTFIHAPAADGGHFTVVSVPPSDRGPHAVRGLRHDDRRPHYYPIRDGSDTRWMNEPEIANHYRSRQLSTDTRRSRERLLVTEGLDFLKLSRETWIYLAVAPEFLADDQIDRQILAEAEDWLYRFGFSSPFGSTLTPEGRPMSKPRRATFSDNPPPSVDAYAGDAPFGVYLELFPNGQFFGACSLQIFDGPGLYYSHIRDDVMTLSGYGLAWTLSRIGAFGTATIEAGILKPPGEGEQSLELVEVRRSMKEQRAVNTRRTWLAPNSRRVAELADSTTTQGRLRVCHQVLADIGHYFGVAEPDGLRADGSLVRNAWLDDPRLAVSWCQNFGVEIH